MSAILFGSISSLVDTSELQREAFNRAFAQHGLDWTWDRDAYAAMLEKSGGADRVASYAAERGEEVDAAAVHASKSEIFQDLLDSTDLQPRAGVVDIVRDARERGIKLGLVTTTSPENVAALLSGLSPTLGAEAFDVIVDLDDVTARKPDGEAYRYALSTLGEQAESCVAIEDNVEGVQSAQAAGISCVAFPNANTEQHDFAAADARTTALELDELTALTTAA